MILSVEKLRALGMGVFLAAGLPRESAEQVVDALVRGELDGMPSHGFSRIPFYADQVLSGKVDKTARPAVTTPAPSVVRVDACNGFAFPAINAGLEQAIPLAKKQGIALLGVTRSHHAGVIGLFVERAAREGLVALAFSNTPAAMAPWNGSKGTFGTNPIAFGCPRTGDPLVIDLSLSKVARGKIMNAKQKGLESIPEGWALDKDGKPTTDPAAALGGTMIPLGDAKGAALALMVEILAATLNGAHHGYEASSFFEAKGEAPGIGQSIILIAPGSLNPGFADRLEALFSFILDQPGTRLPGQRRFETRRKLTGEGVNLPDKLYQDLCRRAGLEAL